jgi:riboflavin kinase / FMN adenylyltransferase
MRVATSLADAGSDAPSVVSIGNFDGLHRGHKAILETVVRRSQELKCRSVAMTFSPHPIRFLAPYKAPKLISTLHQKIRLIETTGIDVLLVVNFDETLSRLSPESFIEQYLVTGLLARSVCVGSNFNFGYRGTGSVKTLREWGRGLEVIEVPPVQARGGVVSSTRVRELIEAGLVSKSCRLLGRWPELEGSIVSGAGRGRTVTVPTLNLSAENELLPARGVYVTRISLDGGPFLHSVTNVGVRPTFNEATTAVETFVLNDPVPESVVSARVRFLKRLRDEVKFDSPEALRRQIAVDIGQTQRFNRRLSAFGNVQSHSR